MTSLFSFRFDITRKAQTQDILMVFVSTEDIEADALATLIEGEIQKNLVPDQVLIVMRAVELDKAELALTKDPINITTFERLRGRASVTLLGYDVGGNEALRSAIVGPNAKFDIKFSDFQRRAISHIFQLRHGFVESTSAYHFRNPSGRHTERFIRLSNILIHGSEIAFIAFCILRFIPREATMVYLDTPSLFTIVGAINEQRTSFPGTKPLVAENFSSYAGLRGYVFAANDTAFVLISASSSGSLASSLIDKHYIDRRNIAHLLFLGSDGSRSNIICDLSWDQSKNPEGVNKRPLVEDETTCQMCAQNSFPIQLKDDQFEFAGPQQDPLLIMKDSGPKGLAEVMRRNAGRGIFTVGISNDHVRGPRQFEISHTHLLVSDVFLERLDYVLRRSLPSSIGHIIAADEASIELATLAAAHAGSNVAILSRDRIFEELPHQTTTAVVVVAAVIESGRGLQEISRDLRSIIPKAPISYLVGMSKSTGQSRRDALGRNLVQTSNPFPYEFIEIERVILPASSGENAWTDELRLLSDPDFQTLSPPALRPRLEQRRARLLRASEPMTNELFLGNRQDDVPSIQPGFVFWPEWPQEPLTQADVYFTIGSVLQQLRANGQSANPLPSIKSNWFQQTVLAPGNFGRYNDDVIQASLLRAANPSELNYVETEYESREMGRLVKRVLEAAHVPRGGAAAEFLLAIATRRLKLRNADLKVVVETKTTGMPLLTFLQEICRTLLTDKDF